MLLRCDKDSLSALTNAAQPLSPAFLERVQPAVEEDFDTEFLALELAVKVVDNVDEAIKHINTHGSHHTDTIITSTISGASASTTLAPGSASATADYFTRSVSSANVYVNASTRFADGFRYGFGTEVGISTGRTHARGPVGLEGLVIYKYVARGEGSAPHKVADFAPGDAAKQPRKWAHQEIEKTYPTFA